MNKETYNALYGKNKANRPKKKGFIGALIGIGASLVGNIIGGAIKRRQEEKAMREKAIIQNKQDTYNQANALTNQYTNQEYVDEMNNRIEFAAGGKSNKVNYGNVRLKRFAAGGDKNTFDSGSVISGVGEGLNSVLGSVIGNVNLTPIQSTPMSLTNAKVNLKPTNYKANNVSLPSTYDRLEMFRLGGKRGRYLRK